MTREEITLVKNSFNRIKDIKTFTNRFYINLFEYEPSFKALFKNDVKKQQNMFTEALRYVVSKIENIDELGEDLKELGLKHQGYGVKPEYYKIVGIVFLNTLKDELKENFQIQHFDAWLNAYQVITSKMIRN